MFVAASLLLREAVVPPEIGPALPFAGAFAGWCSAKSLWLRGAAQGLGVSYQRQSKLNIQTVNAELFACLVCSGSGAWYCVRSRART